MLASSANSRVPIPQAFQLAGKDVPCASKELQKTKEEFDLQRMIIPSRIR